MNCTACGRANIDSAAFCESCGTRMQAQPAAIPAATPPPPPPAAPPVAYAPPPTAVPPPLAYAPPAPPVAAPMAYAQPPNAQGATTASALIESMSPGEKVSGCGAVAAVIGFFLPWISITGAVSVSGLELGKDIGAVYLVLLNALAACALCYFSSKAPESKKLLFAGYLVFIGAVCGPENLTALIFVSKIQVGAGIGAWLSAAGFTAVAAGGMMTIRSFSHRTY